jgi:hypothetical protein
LRKAAVLAKVQPHGLFNPAEDAFETSDDVTEDTLPVSRQFVELLFYARSQMSMAKPTPQPFVHDGIQLEFDKRGEEGVRACYRHC